MSTNQNMRLPDIEKYQKRDFADQLDIVGLLLQAMGFPTRKLRDGIDAILGANGGKPGEFKRTHKWMARRCQYAGEHPETFWRRMLDAIEEATRETGYQPIRIKRGGGKKHEVTAYEEFLIEAANWIMNAARTAVEAGQFKSYRAAVFALIPEALQMIPRLSTEADQEHNPMPLDDELYIQRTDNQSLNLAEKVLERVVKNGGDVDAFAEHHVRRYLKRVQDLKRKRDQAGGLHLCHPPEQEPEAGRVTNLSPSDDEPEEGRVTSLLPSEANNPYKTEQKPDVLATVLAYTAHGLRVLPAHEITPAGTCSCKAGAACGSPGKHPRIVGWQKAATIDPAQIEMWLRQWPNTNWAVTPDKGLIILDVDPAKGGDDSLRKLCDQYGPLDETLTTLTGGGGFQAFFKTSSDVDIKNSVSSIGEGLDVRAKGGLGIIAPSLHASGKRYQLIEAPIADAPEWLLEKLTEPKQAAQDVSTTKTQPQAKSSAATGALIPEGQRHDKLVAIACAMKGQGYDLNEILTELTRFRDTRSHPGTTHPVTDDELLKIAKSVLHYPTNAEKAMSAGTYSHS